MTSLPMVAAGVPLPGGVDEAGVKARLEQGVLEVRLPKSERGRTAAVPIRVR